MSRIKIVILFILTTFLDLSILSRFSIYGLAPFIGLPVIIILSMKAKTEKITYFAIFLGLIMDIYFSNLLGLRALSYYLISYYTFKNRRFEGNSFTYGLAAIFLASLFNSIYMFAIKSFASINTFSSKMLKIFAKSIATEVLLGICMYAIAYVLVEKLLFREKKNFFN
ncbi:MAG: rod shape-determining protein MreD [Tissierellia bacterium]|nr:rod shape-determining protein MreD [Tissierellia bacterium]